MAAVFRKTVNHQVTMINKPQSGKYMRPNIARLLIAVLITELSELSFIHVLMAFRGWCGVNISFEIAIDLQDLLPHLFRIPSPPYPHNLTSVKVVATSYHHRGNDYSLF